MSALPSWIARWWDQANGRRFKLIKLKHVGGGLTTEQEQELVLLQHVAAGIMNYAAPVPKVDPELNRMINEILGQKPSPEAMSLGRLARLDGHPSTINPFVEGGWLWDSWYSGWTEADNDPAAPKEPLRVR